MTKKELNNENYLEKSKKNQNRIYPNINIEKETNNQDIYNKSLVNNSSKEKHINGSLNIIKTKKEESNLSYVKCNIEKFKISLDSINIIFKFYNKKFFFNLIFEIYDESKKKLYRVIYFLFLSLKIMA